MPEDTNTNVDEEIIDGSELSTDEEVDIDSMNEDQLRDFAKREREAKERAVAHMKEQAKKRKSIEESVKGNSQVTTDEPKATQTIEELRAEAKRMIQEEHREARIAEYSSGSTDWLKAQSWANDINASDTLYGEFSQELKRLAEKKDVRSSADFRKLMKLAAVTVTGKPDALVQDSAEAEVTTDKQQSAGYRSSQPTAVATYSGLSEGDRKIVDRINSRRLANGQKSLTPSEVQKILNNK